MRLSRAYAEELQAQAARLEAEAQAHDAQGHWVLASDKRRAKAAIDARLKTATVAPPVVRFG